MMFRRPSRDALLLLGVFAIALAVRLLHAWQTRDLPTIRLPLSDARSYYDWSSRILAGAWWRGEVFYQAPLYPYFLAVVRALTGGGVATIRIVQAILGSVSCVLLALAGRRFAGRAAGMAAGFLLALNGPAVFFDGILQKTALDAVLVAGLLAILAAAQDRPRHLSWLAGGLLLGLLCLSRENALLLVPLVPLWLWLRFRGSPAGIRARWLAAFALGVTLVLGTAAARNASVGGGFVVTTAQLGPNLFIGNNPRANGTYVPLRPGREDPAHERTDATALAEAAAGRKLSPSEISAYWVRRTLDFVRAEPARFLKLTLRKLFLTFNATEIADAEDFYVHAEHGSLLRGLSWINHFGILLPLAAAGVVFTWRNRRDLWILYLLFVALILAVVPFYVLGRYRYPLVLPLAIFAAAALVRAREFLARRRLRELAMPGVALAGVALAAHLPLISREQQRVAAWVNLGATAAETGRLEEALRYEEDALRRAPELLQAHFQRGVVLQRLKRSADARAAFERVLAMDPAHVAAWNALGTLLLDQGQVEEAAARFRKVVELEPGTAEAHTNLAIALSRVGRYDEAAGECRRALAIDPRSAGSHALLGWMASARGDQATAVASLEKAIELDPKLATAHLHLASAIEAGAASDASRWARAEQHLRIAVALDPAIPGGYERLLQDLARQGKASELASVIDAFGAGAAASDLCFRAGWEMHRQGRSAEAIAILSAGHERSPDHVDLANALAWILATASTAKLRDPARALALARDASRLAGAPSPYILDTEAAALAASGRFEEAAGVAARAADLARQRSDPALAAEIEARARLYRAGRGFVEG